MKRNIVILTICIMICFLPITSASMMNPISDVYPSKSIPQTEQTYDWPDGSFTGEWTQGDSQGHMTGHLNQGRRPTIGRMYGEWNTTNSDEQGRIEGIFRGPLVFGKKIADTTSVFFGFINFDDKNFNGIFLSKQGILRCSGIHQESYLPSFTGLYDVGVLSIHMIDENRLEEFTADDPDDFREIMVQLWYPVDKDTPNQRIDYMDEITFEWLMGRSPIPLIQIPKTAYKFVRPYSKTAPPISQENDMFPIIIFSHGYDGVFQIYTSLIEDLTSHGFIVASINHPYVAGVTVFPDGRSVYLSPDPPGEYAIRTIVEDAKFVLDELTIMNETDPFFSGHLDLSKVGMYGHSFGGANTAICCYEDERFLAGLTLDGVIREEYIPEGIDQPFCIMLADGRFNSSSIDLIWNLLNDDAYKVGIIGSTHYGYTDVGLLLGHLVPLIPPNLLGFGSIEPKRMVNITKSFEIAFFEVYLKDMDREHILDLSSVFNEVEFGYK